MHKPASLARVKVKGQRTLERNLPAIHRQNRFARRALAGRRDVAHNFAVLVSPHADEVPGRRVAVADPGQRPVDAQPLGEIEGERAVILEIEHPAPRPHRKLLEQAVGRVVEEVAHVVGGDAVGEGEFLLGELLDGAPAAGIATPADVPT